MASLNRSWQSNKGTFSASGLAGIEPMPSESERLHPALCWGMEIDSGCGMGRSQHGPALCAHVGMTHWLTQRFNCHWPRMWARPDVSISFLSMRLFTVFEWCLSFYCRKISSHPNCTQLRHMHRLMCQLHRICYLNN